MIIKFNLRIIDDNEVGPVSINDMQTHIPSEVAIF